MNWSDFLKTLLNAVVPVIVAWIQKLLGNGRLSLPACAAGACAVAHKRATVRQWVVDMLTEFGNVAATHLPFWLKPEIGLVEKIVEQAIDSALDSAGL